MCKVEQQQTKYLACGHVYPTESAKVGDCGSPRCTMSDAHPAADPQHACSAARCDDSWRHLVHIVLTEREAGLCAGCSAQRGTAVPGAAR